MIATARRLLPALTVLSMLIGLGAFSTAVASTPLFLEVRILSASGSGSFSGIAQGIQFDVSSMSSEQAFDQARLLISDFSADGSMPGLQPGEQEVLSLEGEALGTINVAADGLLESIEVASSCELEGIEIYPCDDCGAATEWTAVTDGLWLIFVEIPSGSPTKERSGNIQFGDLKFETLGR